MNAANPNPALKHGITQKRLAIEAGVSIKTVGRIERGEGDPSLENLWAVATALDTTLGEIVSGA